MMKRLLTAMLLLLSFTALAQDDDDDNDKRPVRAERMKQTGQERADDDDNPNAVNPLKQQLMQQATVIKIQLTDRNRAAAENAFRKSMQLLERYDKQLENKLKNVEKQDEKAMLTEMINGLKEEREELKQLSYEMVENGEEIIGKFNSIAEEM